MSWCRVLGLLRARVLQFFVCHHFTQHVQLVARRAKYCSAVQIACGQFRSAWSGRLNKSSDSSNWLRQALQNEDRAIIEQSHSLRLAQDLSQCPPAGLQTHLMSSRAQQAAMLLQTAAMQHLEPKCCLYNTAVTTARMCKSSPCEEDLCLFQIIFLRVFQSSRYVTDRKMCTSHGHVIFLRSHLEPVSFPRGCLSQQLHGTGKAEVQLFVPR